MLTKFHPANKRYQTLAEALSAIDPDGSLSPGTPQHNRVTDIILAWMAEMEPEDVVRMSRSARRLARVKLR